MTQKAVMVAARPAAVLAYPQQVIAALPGHLIEALALRLKRYLPRARERIGQQASAPRPDKRIDGK